MKTPAPTTRRRVWPRLLALWLVLLAASHAVRLGRRPPEPAPGERSVELRAVRIEEGHLRRDAQPGVRMVWSAGGPEEPPPGVLPVVLLHGSPGAGRDLGALAAELGDERPTLRPSLPGFGRSTRDVPDYSIRAHADYVLQWLDRLGLARVHVVGYSMGGGVALELADEAPERVASLTLLSGLGVQELELFGDAGLNHGLHAAQLFLLKALLELVPHFGWWDDGFLSVEYARNFYDTDQRRLRPILSRWGGPMLVLHGRDDALVPFAVALEDERLVPQSELVALEGGHLLAFTDAPRLARHLKPFLRRVEAGRALLRADADPERRARAAAPFDPETVPPLAGLGLLLFGVLAALATLVSEDLTCVGVGALVAQGRVPFWPGALACFLGIYVGDLLLFLAGRYLGRPALDRAPLAWVLTPERVERSSRWFRERGPFVIFASRFLPGARLPTYFAAGALRTSLVSFSLWFALAAGLWTPLLVGLSSVVGGELSERVAFLRGNFLLALGTTVLAAFLLVRVVLPLATWRGRRLFLSRWRRLTRWEFWPPWLFYPPIVVHVLGLALRHRGLTFTAANPAMPLSGFIGESKGEILGALSRVDGRVPRTTTLSAAATADEREAAARAFRERHGLSLPLVLKPDVGQRGEGVVVARDEDTFRRTVRAAREDLLLQEYVPGAEFGLFYVRHPDARRGTLFSVAEKRLPSVRGDGRRTLERLILEDDRAVCLARFHLRRHARDLETVPAAGEERLLGELGTHCQGAVFLDARDLATPELERAVDELARSYEGFAFGRFDVRSPSAEALGRGEFQVLELNGVTSEAAHVYHPGASLRSAWGTIARQWTLAFEIGAAQARRGAPVARLRDVLGALVAFHRRRGRAAPKGPAEIKPASPAGR